MLGAGRCLSDTMRLHRRDKGSGGWVLGTPGEITNEEWAWGSQIPQFNDGSRFNEGSVLLKGVYFSWTLLPSIKSLWLLLTLQMPGKRFLLGMLSLRLEAELPITASYETVCGAFCFNVLSSTKGPSRISTMPFIGEPSLTASVWQTGNGQWIFC